MPVELVVHTPNPTLELVDLARARLAKER